MARFRFPYILTLSLSTLAFGAVGCSNGSSPTEPAFDDLSAPVAATSSVTDSSVVSDGDEKRRGRGSDDGSDGSGGSGGSGGGSTDDNDNNRQRRGRGGDDGNGDDRGRRRGGRGGNDDPRPAGTSQFEARVLSVNGNTLNLAGGTRVIVNGSTQWIARGDLRTLAATSAAVAANRPVRAEGRGTRQADGSFIAQTLKVEVDD